MYAVAGVTGHTGRVVAESLLEQGERVIAIVHKESSGEYWKSRGVEVAVADLGDAESLRRILDKVEGAYLLLPPNYGASAIVEDRRKIVEAIAQAVKDSGVFHVVFLSSIGGHVVSGTGPIVLNHYGESILSSVAANITLLRPSYFIENWEPLLATARDNGILNSFLMPKRKIAMTATRDIGRIAAECLSNPAHGRRVVELSGPEDYSPEDIARIIGSILHRDVRVESLPLTSATPALKAAGFSEEAARLFEEMYAGINSGRIAFERRGAEFRRGRVGAAEVLAELLKHLPQSAASAAV